MTEKELQVNKQLQEEVKWLRAENARLRKVNNAIELAEFKACMQVEQLTNALQKIHNDFSALAVTAEVNQTQLLEQLERLQQTSIFRALAEIDRLRAVLEFYADEKNFATFDSRAIKDGGRKARKVLEGLDGQG